MDPLLFIEPYKNFEKLCPDLVFQYRLYREETERNKESQAILPYKDIEQMQEHIAMFDAFKSIKPFDKTRRQEIADILNIFYRKILEQPFWYLEAVERYPDSLPLEDKLFERAKSVFYRVEHAEDTFNEMIVSVKHQLRDLVKNDKVSAIKLFNEILYITDRLILSSGRNSFDQWHFDYKKSPLFIFFMEFIQEIKNRAGNSAEYYHEVETYLSNINSYKEQYNEVVIINKSVQPTEYVTHISKSSIDALNIFVQEEISYWSNLDPNWKIHFETEFIKGLIKVCSLTLLSNPNRYILLSDFISGLALLPFPNTDKYLSSEFYRLTQPTIDFVIKYFKSEHWQKWLIEKEVTGQATMKVNDITIPITPEELLLHIKRTNKLVLTTESIISLEKDWRKYIRERYHDEDSSSLMGLSTKFSKQEISSIFDRLLKLHFVKATDRGNFDAIFQPDSLPFNWGKVKWLTSRKECFSFMMDMCGNEIEAQTINLYFTQYAINKKTKIVNDKPLNPRDRSNYKPGFLSRLLK